MRPSRQATPADAGNGADGLRAKVSYLSDPASYPERPTAVELVQTHMSCVFLTDRHAWKLKKPVRYPFLDFSTREARRIDCEEELRLNRRLAADVYLEVVPLALAPGGGFALGGGGEAADWLVKMRRLPRRLMLDQALREGGVERADVTALIRALVDFYRGAEPVPIDPARYRLRFESGIREGYRELACGGYGLPAQAIAAAEAGALAALERETVALERRARERRIVEGHGDLRPEHVCLGAQPLVIDCLEFNRDWRVLDPADELAYLALECVHAGAAWIGDVALASYREQAADPVPAGLLAFYQAYRAGIRARLCAWHLHDHPDPADQGRWIARAQRYLDLAQRRACADPVRP